MSRTPGASCLLDVRTTAIMQDYVLSTDICAPGAALALARRQLTGGYLLDNCQPPVCGYDRSRDMVSVFGAVCVVATVIGVIHTLPLFIPAASLEYNAGFIELCLLNALTYFFALATACFTNILIDCTGHKLAALFGMILMFVGLLLDSQVIHISVLYVSNIGLIGIGGGFAYAAAVTLPSDLFRAKILKGVLFINLAGSIGTIFYTWIIVSSLHILGFKWTKLMLAFIVLFFSLAVHAFPKTRLMYNHNCDVVSKTTSDIRECVYQHATAKEKNCDNHKSCLCICVCDLRLYSDKSFVLWSCLVMFAAMNFQVPYLYLVSYSESVGAQISAWYITTYCLASMFTRSAFIFHSDYTFAFNRTLFQICLCGIMWILMNWASTYGWILVMCAILGGIEGTLCIITSRVAMGTIPVAWLGGAWVSSIICHAIGMFIASLFTAVIALQTFHYYVAFMTIGVIQFVIAVLVTLLPNEDDEGGVGVGSAPQPQFRTRSGGYEYTKTSYGPGGGGGGIRNTGGFANGPATGTIKRPDYKCKCPICSRIGCIPECLPACVPAGTKC